VIGRLNDVRGNTVVLSPGNGGASLTTTANGDGNCFQMAGSALNSSGSLTLSVNNGAHVTNTKPVNFYYASRQFNGGQGT
jgi:hypothetical protein